MLGGRSFDKERKRRQIDNVLLQKRGVMVKRKETVKRGNRKRWMGQGEGGCD